MSRPSTTPAVLVAEDDATIRRLIQIILEQNGYRALVAEDGEEALRRCLSNPPDLAILDVRMPKRSAWELLDALRVRGLLGRFPIIVLTASPGAEAEAEGYSGICLTMAKPFDNAELIRAVESCLKAAA